MLFFIGVLLVVLLVQEYYLRKAYRLCDSYHEMCDEYAAMLDSALKRERMYREVSNALWSQQRARRVAQKDRPN